MTNKWNVFARMRNARIERILSTPPTGFMISSGFRRFLSITAVVVSYLYLATLLLPMENLWAAAFSEDMPASLTDLDGTQLVLLFVLRVIGYVQLYGPTILLVTFLLLRRSMRRVTSLPNEYLDEREMANRDWAFRTGYLVIRRVGLALAAAFFFINALGYSPVSGEFSKQEDTVIAVKAFNEYLISLTSANTDPELGLTPNNAVVFYAHIIALLAYVAYSFPLILLAWREAKVKDVVPQPVRQPVIRKSKPFARTYFRRIFILVGLIFGFVFIQMAGILVFPALGNWMLFRGGFFISLFGITAYGLYIYIWASVKTASALLQARKNRYNEGSNASASVGGVALFTLTQALGISVAVSIVLAVTQSPFSNANPLGVALLVGLAMIPVQVLSVAFIRNLETTNPESTREDVNQ
jgi:predicted outer membrane lipoprotein